MKSLFLGVIGLWWILGTAYGSSDGSKRFDQISWLTTHNAYANNEDALWFFPNQGNLGIRRQLQDGVRALMLDIHSWEGRATLCHGSCKGVPLVSPRQDLVGAFRTIYDFLTQDPATFITVFFEDYTSPEELGTALEAIPGLRELIFHPESWQVRERGWPLLGDLLAANQRLLLISDRSDKRELGVVFAQDWTVENYWSMGLQGKDRRCYSRWDHLPLDKKEEHFQRLFVMNHFRDVPTSTSARLDNRLSDIWDRLEKECKSASGGRLPNFLAVDYYAEGEAAAVVARLNQ